MSSDVGHSLIARMFQRDYGWLCGRMNKALGCPHSAQDIASETFLRVLTLADPAAIREPRALLTTIARRLMYEGWRRFLGAGLVMLLGVGLGYRILDEEQDDVLATATAQRLQRTLEDGSKLTINARSRVRTQFDATQRLLRLQQGELLVDVARDSLRPFVVQSDHGCMRALGTRFQVREEEAATHIVMFHSQVEIVTNDGTRQLIKAGQFAHFDADRILELGTASGGEDAWTGGHLEARDQPLGEVIDSLRPYRRGIVQVSPQAAQLRLSGIYPLDDSNLSLRLLEESLPIRISYRTPYWVVIEER